MKLWTAPTDGVGREAEHRGAYGLLEKAVRQEYGIELPEIRRDAKGKPYFPSRLDIQFNLSHTKGLIACGISDHPVGVDVEWIRPLRERVMRRAFAAEEIRAVRESPDPDEMFFRIWTGKESYVKALGIGISYPLQDVVILPAKDGAILAPEGWTMEQKILRAEEMRWVVTMAEGDGEI